MSIVSVDRDYDDLSVTMVAEFEAAIEQVWTLWSDPRKLERWWGPPAYPATFEKHDLTAGGEAAYYMTGEEGDTHRGAWRVNAVEPPSHLQFTDLYVGSDGAPNVDLPQTEVDVRLTERDGGTRMEMRSTFESRQDMEKWMRTGTYEGLQEALGQMDALLDE